MSTKTLPKPHLTATLVLACLAQFMVILDVSVVNVALPSIKHALGFQEDSLQWVINAYTVTFAGFLLLGGRAADLFGRRRTFVFGLLLFSLASLAAGVADSRSVLITARLIQGLGGAIVAPSSLSLLTSTFIEPKARHRAVGTWGAMGGAGASAGVLLGGVLTDLLSWRWIFFINLPIGLITAFLAHQLLIEGRNDSAKRNLDLAGAFTATVGLSAIVFGVVRTDSAGWGDPITLIAIGGGIVMLLAFLAIEGLVAKAPLMPLRLFRSRQLSAANLSIAVVGASTFAMWFFLSLYLQDVLGYSPLKAGIVFLPMTLAVVVGSAVASRFTMRIGARRMLIIGMVLLCVGLALLTDITVQGDYVGELMIPGLLASFGLPLAFIPGNIAATSGVPQSEAGLASAVVSMARMFGGAIGLAVLTTIATTHSNQLLHGVSPSAHAVDAALVSGFQLGFWVASGIAGFGILVAVFAMPSPCAIADRERSDAARAEVAMASGAVASRAAENPGAIAAEF